MADDSNRDLVAVRDLGCLETCRSNIDPRERHLVCKLDRYELEDKYLRLLNEAHNLKKYSNGQEDKIKKLVAKLMRVSVTQKACRAALETYEDKARIHSLELENGKLKDKVKLMRTHLMGRTNLSKSSTRNPRPPTRPSSGLPTNRSENCRTKTPSCQCILFEPCSENNFQNTFGKLEELETEKNAMGSRIQELEKELATKLPKEIADASSEKVEAVFKELKQLNDKLIATQETNSSLYEEVNDLKKMLNETTKNNQETTAALVAEQKRATENDEQKMTMKNTETALREQEERVKDLLNEIAILKQHNNELIGLSSNCGQVEQENVELKRRISEEAQNQHTLKTAFCTEQANIAALQAANEKLMDKLQELQGRIDSLTLQLTTFKQEKETCEVACIGTQASTSDEFNAAVDNIRRNSIQLPQKCKRCCEAYEKIVELEKVVNTVRDGLKTVEKYVQTEDTTAVFPSFKEPETSAVLSQDASVKEQQSSDKEQDANTAEQNEKYLSREEMMKLLDQAQIYAPKDVANAFQRGNTLLTDVELDQRHRQVVALEKLLFGDSTC